MIDGKLLLLFEKSTKNSEENEVETDPDIDLTLHWSGSMR